jgi:threonine dehydrogenase-like Zn-dependent dehydrogenase
MRQLVFVPTGQYEWHEVAEPGLASDKAALIRPIAVSRCDLDLAIARGRVPAARAFAVGHEVVGEVVAIGEAVRAVRIGQRVIVPFQISCAECAHCRAGLTRACMAVAPRSTFGLPGGDRDWGGGLADLMHVPFADAMLVGVPDGVDPAIMAAGSDNLPDGYRLVADGLARHPGADVLVLGGTGGASCGLYAVATAVGLGAAGVDYVDSDAERLSIAERLGARIIDQKIGPSSPPIGAYLVTADATTTEGGLSLALRSTAWEGICTGVGGFVRPSKEAFPFTLMYMNNVTLRVEMVNAKAELCRCIAHIAAGTLDVAPIISHRLSFDQAADAMAEPAAKMVFMA